MPAGQFQEVVTQVSLCQGGSLMKNLWPISWLYYVATIYDAVLGLAFLLVAPYVFEVYGVAPPNHPGYAQFPAALLLVFALMYLAIARDPIRNRNLIPFGALLKVAYCGVVFFHWFSDGIPDMWKPFAVIDLVFLVLFVWAYATLSGEYVGRAQSANSSR